MNNIVETYLMFKANTVCEYINILAEDMRKVSKIPRQLNKLIYKYYDLHLLSSKPIDYETLKKKTGLNEENERLILFYLLIEKDIASKTEFKDKELYDFYNLLVNSIIIFSELENNKISQKNIEYDNNILKVLNKHMGDISKDYILLIDKLHDTLQKIYLKSLKKEIKFNNTYINIPYSASYSKIKRSNEFYLEKLRYRNEKLSLESKKDVELINDEFSLDLNFVNIEIASMRILKNIFFGIKRTVFIELSSEIITNKSNFGKFYNMINLRFLKENIVFLINTSLLEKYEERINKLILDGFNVSYLKNCNLAPYDIYKYGGYMVVDYEELANSMNFVKKHNLEIIANKVNRKDADKLKNIKYITS